MLLDFGDGLPEEHLLGLVEAARGVVQDQALGVPDERHSEGEPTLAVDGLESDLDVLVLEQADRVEGFLDVLLAVELSRKDTGQLQVLLRRQVLEACVLFGDVPNLLPCLYCVPQDALPEVPHVALVCL